MSSFPLRIGGAADFARVRSVLLSAAFDEATLCRALGIDRMSEIDSVDFARLDPACIPERLPLFIRLFLRQSSVPRAELEHALGREALESLLALGLVGSGDFGADNVHARVLLYPVAGVWIASDRHTHPDGSPFVASSDIVFPAIFGGTLKFLNYLPRSRAEAALDLCAGTGIGAFVLSRTSARAVASDVTERATHFAEFNRVLNDIDNVAVVCGDLYDAVRGETFDRIVAHPPYVPSLAIDAIWRDGGMTGETLSRRIVEGLPAHLRPGGFACIVSLGPDTAAASFEERVRGWLGEAHGEFDVLFAASPERTREEMLKSLAERDPALGSEGVAKLEGVFAEADVVAFAHGALVLRRRADSTAREGSTRRVRLSDITVGDDLEQAFLLHDALRALSPEALIERSIALAPRLKVKVTHAVEAGALVPADYVFETDKPFLARGEVDGWIVPLVARLDGKSTPRELYDRAGANGELPQGFGLDAFAKLLARMIERGFLTLN